MKINRNLNLVIPVEIDDSTYYVHSMPIAREVFERYFIVISKTFSSLLNLDSHEVLSPPKIAYLMLKKVADEMGEWAGEGGAENGLMNEIIRLSNVILPTEAGWQNVPLQSAITRGSIDDEALADIKNYIVFFIVASAMHSRRDKDAILQVAGGIWGLSTTLLNCTEYKDSLLISTKDDSSGASEKAS